MNAIDIIALCAIAVAMTAAVRAIIKRKVKCGGCSGDCSKCPHR